MNLKHFKILLCQKMLNCANLNILKFEILYKVCKFFSQKVCNLLTTLYVNGMHPSRKLNIGFLKGRMHTTAVHTVEVDFILVVETRALKCMSVEFILTKALHVSGMHTGWIYTSWLHANEWKSAACIASHTWTACYE